MTTPAWRWDYIFRCQPISLNNAYPQDKTGRRYPSADLKKFKRLFSDSLRLQDTRRGKPPIVPFYRATWVFCYPRLNSLSEENRRVLGASPDGLFFKNGKLQKRDVSNLFKAAEDCLFDHLGGPDDRQVMSLAGYKRVVPSDQAQKPFMLLFLSEEEEGGAIYHGSERIELDEWARKANHSRV